MDETITKTMTQQQSILYAIQHYGQRLLSYIRSRVGSDQEAEDILQDVWFQLISIVESRPVEQLGAWLYRVSRNRIINKQRRMNPLSLEEFSYENEDSEWLPADAVIEEIMDPESDFEKEFFRQAFLKVLNELPEKQKQVFIWNELEDMTLQQIADKTGENIKTIISRKRYAVSHLQKRLQSILEE